MSNFKFVVLVIFFLPKFIVAQDYNENYYFSVNNDSLLFHFDQDGSLIFSNNYSFFRKVVTTQKIFPYENEIIDYYNNGKIAFVASIDNGIFNGVCKSYYANGKIEFTGNYKNGIADGKWIYYYDNDSIEKILTYTDDVIYIEKYQDKDGDDFIINGSGTFKMEFLGGLSKSEKREIFGRVENNLMNGKWKFLDATEQYIDGKLVEGKGYCLKPFYLSNVHEKLDIFKFKIQTESNPSNMPEYIENGRRYKIHEFINLVETNLKSSGLNEIGECWSFSKFIVTKNGEIEDLYTKSNNKILAEEINKLITESSNHWKPAFLWGNDKKIDSFIYMPVVFQNGSFYVGKLF
ncbi:MAG: hypothetical protein QM786_10555 [Breznakibacter sp.]